MSPLINGYNDAFTKIEEKQYVYRSWLDKYWDTQEVKPLTATFSCIGEFDKVLHSLNDEFESVNISKTKSKIDPERGSSAAKEMKALWSIFGTT